MLSRQHGAFISARYSTDNQNPDSIEVQVGKCTQWCNQRGVPILGVFADEAVSGMKDSRPQYEAMMNQLRLGLADTVVIYDQSRMFRKMTAWFSFRDELAAMGVAVVSVTQPMIGKDLRDPTNFLTEGSMALFNQIWALQTRQKVMEKMRFMARNGQHTGGKPALGYIVQDGKLVICEEEAAVVRRIFSEYAAGKSYREIIEGLNRDGLKTKRGNPFGTNSLHDLLHNEKYIGTLVYGQSPYREDGTRNTHSKDGDAIRIERAIPAIIDKDVFDMVQQKMAGNKRQQGGRPATKRDYPLRGKVFCAECKSAMTISTSKGNYYYYKCTQKKRQHNCDAANISVDLLERTVAETVREVLGKPGNAEKLIRILREQRSAVQADAVIRLQAMIEQDREISRKLSNAADAVLDGRGSQTILARIQDLEHQQAELAAQMRSLKASVDASAIPEQTLRDIVAKLATADNADPAIYLSIVYRVEVGKDSITIWTILDANPDGTYDFDADGVLLTPGVPSGVPKKGNTIRCFPFFDTSGGLEYVNSTVRWTVDCRRIDGGNTIMKRVPSGVPKENNPNLMPVGEGFGLFLHWGPE